ncbi:hypothetical protein MPTK1_1g17400 [Marchantia polymorpha subsp. ruderalis]|uniref:RCC1-like domain-containing protein n=2 Tax=Marchantia polymorpha TaxID=3197 RepID=A0AAF6AR72_MARPO|nr:hypothetical protein MARPO_0001s0080 [Marchantia polymorpha]BBM98942.1 hypothetical protein Mp_1g17400 [Marchantia polymorpha subsp. ruderalis]|eukprot:PTQ50019.1 hypothetical protein MARPO_0001s0080 [Marchantia polymorpha]
MWRQRAKLLEAGLGRCVADGFRGVGGSAGIGVSCGRGCFGLGPELGREGGGGAFRVRLHRAKHCVALWGNGDHGRLGLSSASSSNAASRWEPTVCESLAELEPIAVACGGAHTLVLTDEGRVLATGLNDHGQLGAEQLDTHQSQFVEVVRGLPSRCVHIAAGYNHSGAITDDGAVYVWGSNAHGQLGLGKKAEKLVHDPTRVEALRGIRVKKLALGAEHSLALSEDGDVLSWGNGSSGRLGHGRQSGPLRFFGNSTEFLPRLVDFFREIRIHDIAAGLMHSACVDFYGVVYTFGNGRMCQLGNGSSRGDIPEPGALALPAARQVACGGYHTGAVTRLGDLYMCGSNENGCLGFGYKHTDPARFPMKVEGPLTTQNVLEVACGWKHSCALTDKGQLFAWGWGGAEGSYSSDGRSGGGQLGLGNEFDFNEPTLVPVKSMKGVQVSCGFNHTAAIFKEC